MFFSIIVEIKLLKFMSFNLLGQDRQKKNLI